jgi:hypothetical protein
MKIRKMRKQIIVLLLIFMIVTKAEKSYAWGKTGHELVAKIAYQLLDDSTRKMVKEYLGNISF